MKELFEQKRLAAEKALAESGQNTAAGPSAEDKEARKARLMAQRDALRKAKEDKR